MSKGVFLVLEGIDGTSRKTQLNLLADHLSSTGYQVEVFDFPRYDQPSSYFIEQYLSGQYGESKQVNPYTSALFFALDRYQAAASIKQAIEDGKIVLANSFTGSSMANQGGKFANAEERRGFFIWCDNLEFQLLQLPRPTKSYVLRQPHSQNDGSDQIVETYDDLCSLFPKDFERVETIEGGEAHTDQEIHDHLWRRVQTLLPPIDRVRIAHQSSTPNETTNKIPQENPYLTKTPKGWEITSEGHEFLQKVVTNSNRDVYAFTDELSALTIAAGMARLSRRGDDMRVTILDEFVGKVEKDEQLLQRVITAYGDDSVQQLVGQHIVVENASNLLTKQLEWGRLASYLEQSTRYIYFDQKDAQGKYKYFTPTQFPKELQKQYDDIMNQIFENYSQMVRQLTVYIQNNSAVPKNEQDGAWRAATRAQACDAIRPVLPVATKSTVGIFASGQALEALIMRLQASDSQEAQVTGTAILQEARKVIPTFLERADKPARGGATVAYLANTRHNVAKIAQKQLSNTHSVNFAPVTLTGVWPRNELDLVPDMLYEHSNSSLNEIKDEVENWTIDQKLNVFDTYMGERLNRRHKPGRALEQAHYSWDLLCDYGIFRDLQRHRMVDDLQQQTLTPRFGYEIPEIVEEAGLGDHFEECFDLSAKLHSQLQSEGFKYEAQYATLLGHRMRYKVTYNARAAFHIHEIRTSPQGHPGYRKLVLEMHEKLAQVHPNLAAAMIFVNKDEDPELTRLAAERATQFKLQNRSD
jgi:thymidylate synthase ThyX/thymidylate kinase